MPGDPLPSTARSSPSALTPVMPIHGQSHFVGGLDEVPIPFMQSHGSERESIQATGTFWFNYLVEYDANITRLLKCTLRVKLLGLKANSTAASSGGSSTSGATATASGGGSTSGSDGGHQHTGTISGSGTHQNTGTTASVSPTDPHAHAFATDSSGSHSHIFTTDSGGNHTHTTPNHTHPSHDHSTPNHTHGITYGIFEQSLPATPAVSVYINGVDRSAALGGPFGTDFKVDITQYLRGGDGRPLYQENTVQFRTTATAFDVVVHAQSLLMGHFSEYAL